VLGRSEKTLVEAVLRRDRKATAEFVTLYADAVYAYIRHRLIPRVDLVDDLMQEIFLAAWQYLPSYRGESSLEGWLLGIARHKIEDYYRDRLRLTSAWGEDTELKYPGSMVFPEWDELLDDEASQKRARRILTGLPEAYRLALLWRYWEYRSTREMAVATGKTEKSLERLLSRARAQFKMRWNNG